MEAKIKGGWRYIVPVISRLQ